MATDTPDSVRMAPETGSEPVESVSPSLPDAVSVTLWLRTSAPRVARERQARVEEREWPNRVSDPVTDAERAALEAFDHYRAVAGLEGVRLDPFFECRTNPDGSRTVVFPVACLALERDGDLTGLYPCYVDGDHAAVEDGLDAIEEGNAENIR